MAESAAYRRFYSQVEVDGVLGSILRLDANPPRMVGGRSSDFAAITTSSTFGELLSGKPEAEWA
jgi:hypothetical protein